MSQKITIFCSKAQYQQLVALLDRLIDEVGEDESHPLADLMDFVGSAIEQYEILKAEGSP